MKNEKIIFLLVVCLTCAGCSTKSREKQLNNRIITDMAGRQVEIPAKITSAFIDRHSVQMVYAFDTMLAVNRVFNYTETEKKFLKKSFYENKPYAIESSAEEIVQLKPNIIFYSAFITPENTEKVNLLQKKTQIPVVVINSDIFEYKEALRFLGDILNKEEKAKELIGFIETYIDPALAKGKTISGKKKKKIYYAEGLQGLKTDPSGSVHSLLIDLVGGINVAEVDILPGKGMTNVSLEQIYVWNPDLILVWSGNFDEMDSYKYIKTDLSWKKLKAVRNNYVYQVPWRPFGWIDRPPGINRLIGIIWLSNLLYPDIYNYGNLIGITKEFFSKFHHYNMTDEETLEILNPQP
ncbi:iron complex transport system substrate-binding protein [termite gut metagenome]|uniref:Iron complex transport system substrate-binding protein n=1 Tax=termite gut metagenome TaxID=433724 RepID=A0A5J4T1T2_9ZZZZ